MALLHVSRVGHFAVRLGALLCVCVLLFVPALTRVTQRLEPVSHAPSFKNIDSPPKKVTVAPLLAIASPIPLNGFDAVRVARLVPPPRATPPPSPICSAPRPLRAPPSAFHV